MSKTDIRICFFGDSFTTGTGDPHYLGWVGRACATARTNGYAVTAYNLGIRRNASADILARWENESEARFPDYSENRIVLSFGANDVLIMNGPIRAQRHETLDNLRTMLREMTAKYPVLFIGPPPMPDPAYNERIAALCPAMQEVAAEIGVPYLPTHDYMMASGTWLDESRANDNAHPMAGGYELFAERVMSWEKWWFKSAT